MQLERPRGRRHPVWAAILALPFLMLSGCSFGPPNLAPILADPEPGSSSGGVMSYDYETAQSYHLDYPYSEDSRDSLMEFNSFRFSFAPIVNAGYFLFVPYFHYLFGNLGAAAGFKADPCYAVASFDFLLLENGGINPHAPHFGAQAGVRLSRYAILTYDYFHLTYMDLQQNGYGWEVLYSQESGASRISLALGRLAYLIPGVIYAHRTGKFGWSLNLTANLGRSPGGGPPRL